MGEPAFRELERQAMTVALDEGPQVIAAGAGWVAQPGNLTHAESRALLIYLSLAPAEAAGRLDGVTDRPLLGESDVHGRIEALFSEREKWYRLAGIDVPAAGPPDQVAAGVAEAARLYGGW